LYNNSYVLNTAFPEGSNSGLRCNDHVLSEGGSVGLNSYLVLATGDPIYHV